MDNITEYRRTLHQYPELSGREFNTRKRIKKWISEFHPDAVEDIGKTGLMVTYKGSNPGPAILLRAELDALPIEEQNNFNHKSEIKGISHKCGHDGHASILIGISKALSKNPLLKGKVYLLFQPAEETGEGAKDILNEERFQNIELDYVFALHNIPGAPLNQIILKKGSFTSAVKSLIINLIGKTSHAAEPENGINPTLAVAELIQEINRFQNTDTSSEDFQLITPIQIEIGEEAFGTSAGNAVIKYTIRTWEQKKLEDLEKKILLLSKKIAETNNLHFKFSTTQSFEANNNEEGSVKIIEDAARNAGFQIKYKNEPFKWGEDFGCFTQKYKGAMFGLGAGENTPALHHPEYDFPDELLPGGIKVFTEIIKLINGIEE